MTYGYVPNRYVTLQNQGIAGPPPRYYGHRGSRGCGCGCLRCCCCCCLSCFRGCICCFFIIIILLVAIVIAMYNFIDPHIPTYDIQNFDVTTFDIRNDNKIYTDMTIVFNAVNPNEDIGLDYGESNFTLIYYGSQISSGQSSPFLQRGKNTTTVSVTMKGKSEFGPEMQQHYMQDQKEGNIPLLVTVKAPIRILVMDFIYLNKFVVGVNCSLLVDQLQSGKKPNILNKEFYYGVEL